jgi:putative transposase
MRDYKSLSHRRWDCKYHIVFIPKRRQKLIFGGLKKHLGEVFQDLARQKAVTIEEGHLMIDHVHMCLSIPPWNQQATHDKYSTPKDNFKQLILLL